MTPELENALKLLGQVTAETDPRFVYKMIETNRHELSNADFNAFCEIITVTLPSKFFKLKK